MKYSIIMVMAFVFITVSPALADDSSFQVAKLFNTGSTDPDKEHWDMANDYAKKGFFKFAIQEFNKIDPGSSMYLDAIQNAAAIAFNMQELDNKRNHYTILVDKSPLLFTSSAFSSKKGGVEDFVPGPNGANIVLEMYSLSNTPITSITFKVFCYDNLLEPVETNKGIYVTTIDNLNIKPYSFYTTTINLDPMGKVSEGKVAVLAVTFADGTSWDSPLKKEDVKVDKNDLNKNDKNMPKHF